MKNEIKKILTVSCITAIVGLTALVSQAKAQEWSSGSQIVNDGDSTIINNIYIDTQNILGNQQLFPEVPVAPTFGEESFMNFYNDCTSSIAQLVTIFERSNQEWMYGNPVLALQSLKRGLDQTASLAKNPHYGILPPYTAITATYAKQYIERIYPVIDRVLPHVSGELLSSNYELKYLLLYRLVSTVIVANHELDHQYYGTMVSDYFKNFGMGKHFFSEIHRRLPLPFFNKVKKLAETFMDIQKELQEYMANNKIELVSAKYMASVTRALLMKSLLRRSFCKPIVGLYNLESLIDYYLTSPTGISGYYQVQNVRYVLDSIRSELASSDFSFGCRY